MVSDEGLSSDERELVSSLVEHFRSKIKDFDYQKNLLKPLIEGPELEPFIHSVKARIKDPAHLHDKLLRKMIYHKSKNEPFPYTIENLFTSINDLVGVRILHLHTTQFEAIDAALRNLLNDRHYEIIEGPVAHTWDDEYKDYFKSVSVETKSTGRMYTSVHYVVSSGKKNTKTAEIQVRTLSEELWGEVDHSINYPHPSSKVWITEQIKVLARLTSSCTRLVDSIYKGNNH